MCCVYLLLSYLIQLFDEVKPKNHLKNRSCNLQRTEDTESTVWQRVSVHVQVFLLHHDCEEVLPGQLYVSINIHIIISGTYFLIYC